MQFNELLTSDEKWHFDHHGFLILRGVLSPSECEAMRALGEEWHGALNNLPAPLHSTSSAHKNYSPTIAHWINRIEYGDPLFAKLTLHPKILRVIIALTQGYPTLVDTALTRNTKDSDDLKFHEVANGYRMHNNEPFADFLNAGVSLVDVPDGSGFVCVPGSHKRNFPTPESVSIYDNGPTVYNPTIRAGDCVIFTESLRHGARRWTGADPRFSVFNRYKAGDCEGCPVGEFKHKISEELLELSTSMPFGTEKKLVRRFLDQS
jgi:hypothetical protein